MFFFHFKSDLIVFGNVTCVKLKTVKTNLVSAAITVIFLLQCGQ